MALKRRSVEQPYVGPKVAPVNPNKDRPLMLRSVGNDKYITTSHFPPRHEFAWDWLYKGALSGYVKISDNDIILDFKNARAVYSRDHSQRSNGVWGLLKSEHYYG